MPKQGVAYEQMKTVKYHYNHISEGNDYQQALIGHNQTSTIYQQRKAYQTSHKDQSMHSPVNQLEHVDQLNFSKQLAYVPIKSKKKKHKPKGKSMDLEMPSQYYHPQHSDIFIKKHNKRNSNSSHTPSKDLRQENHKKQRSTSNNHLKNKLKQFKQSPNLYEISQLSQPLLSKNQSIQVTKKKAKLFKDILEKKESNPKGLKGRHFSLLERPLRKLVATMPVNSKLNSLYSMNGSLVNSKADLEKNQKPVKINYVIPTEESEEIKDMREFYDMIRTEEIEYSRYYVREVESECEESESLSTTPHLIGNYIKMFTQHKPRVMKLSKSKTTEIPKPVPSKQQEEQKPIENQTQTDKIEKPLCSKTIEETKAEQLSKWNALINVIQSKKQQGEPSSVILQQICQKLLNNQQQVKQHQPVQALQMAVIDERSSKIYTNHEDTELESVSLDMLDESLRNRLSYLTDKENKELRLLEESFLRNKISQQEYEAEREKVHKWIHSEIKQVKRIRSNLWKGFTQAHTWLQTQQKLSPKAQKTSMMMKSLSDKFLTKCQPQARQETHQRCKVIQTENEEVRDESSSIKEDTPIKGISELDFLDKMQHEHETQQEQDIIHPPKLWELVDELGGSNSSIDSLQSQSNSLISSDHQADLQPPNFGDIKQRLSIEDKEDIFEFFFLDLCIELFSDEPNNSRIMLKINDFNRENKQRSKRAKGFSCNPTTVKEYLLQFITYLKEHEAHMQKLQNNIDKPLGPTALDILRYMHLDEESQQEELTETVFILDLRTFEEFEAQFLKKLVFEPPYYLDQEREIRRIQFLKNAIHIHNKAIFDSLNECLDKVRPFGLWGQPFSWKSSCQFFRSRNNQHKKQLVMMSAQKTMDLSSYMCGVLLDKQGSVFKNSANISEAHVQQIREERLSRMLAVQLVEGEGKMLFFDDEETEVLVELAHIVFQALVLEAIKDSLFG